MLMLRDYHQPSVEWWGIRMDEPVTSLTDLMVSGVCIYAFFRLAPSGNDPQERKIKYYFRRYFLLMGISTAYGGIIGHAFLYALSFSWKLPGWCLSMISMNFLERAMIEYVRYFIPSRLGRFLTWLNLTELLVFLVITLFTQKFYFVEIHAAYGLLGIVFPISLYIFFKSKDKEPSRFFLYATFTMMIASVIFRNRLGINPWMNHNDMAHLLMCLAGYFFFCGALRIKGSALLPKNENHHSALLRS